MRTVEYLLAVTTMAVLVLNMPAQAQSVTKQLQEARQKERASDLEGAIQLYEPWACAIWRVGTKRRRSNSFSIWFQDFRGN
ncbi:MAG: hypothetical protein ACYSTG_03895 [Planctomycetota bacterium]|jgi:hypothetical protein